MQIELRTATTDDAHGVVDIYNPYVTGSIITFEEEAVPGEEMSRRIQAVRDHALPWLVATSDTAIIGFAYATPWRPRRAYRFSVEVSVYLAPEHCGSGIGRALYTELLAKLRSQNVHAALGGIALPNVASVTLHEKFGFTKVAHLREVGFKLNRWIDVGYWELIL